MILKIDFKLLSDNSTVCYIEFSHLSGYVDVLSDYGDNKHSALNNALKLYSYFKAF